MMLTELRNRIIDLNTLISSLVRQHTGLLVSICIVIGCLFIAGCGDDAVLYEVGAGADGADKGALDTAVAVDIEDVTVGDDTSAGASGDTADTDSDAGTQVLVVHLCGAVNNPGVYELDMDSRIIDGINKAGGFREDASADSLNLAMELTDGSRIYVPTTEEAAEADKTGAIQVTGQTQYVSGPELSSEDEGKVNINLADEDKLTTLTGIGPSRAKAIIAYREEHGGFKSPEELMNVSGIGKASYDKLKNDITI